jgi:hypothetical protein
LRSVGIGGSAIMINGRRIFQRLVVDQGYRRESLMTAPDDEALRATSSCPWPRASTALVCTRSVR